MSHDKQTPTPESLRPTPGAVRAAKLLCPDIGNPMVRNYDEMIVAKAEIIDRETGVRELLDALKGALTRYVPRIISVGDACVYSAPAPEPQWVIEARTAIARCEGK